MENRRRRSGLAGSFESAGVDSFRLMRSLPNTDLPITLEIAMKMYAARFKKPEGCQRTVASAFNSFRMPGMDSESRTSSVQLTWEERYWEE